MYQISMYDLFVSGGRDSVVAATIGFRRAKAEGIKARVVFIKEFDIPSNLDIPDPLEYVQRFAEWLGVELIVLKPKIDFWEGVKRWGYPHVFQNRWCYQKLKKEPLLEFLRRERLEERVNPVWVLGIRRSESQRREKLFAGTKEFNIRIMENGLVVAYWFPILDWTDKQVEEFIRQENIPPNPLWKLGFSFECLCMAGTSLNTLIKMIHTYPKLAEWLAEKDREVQKFRQRKDPSYPTPLLEKRMSLHTFIESELKKKKISDFMKMI